MNPQVPTILVYDQMAKDYHKEFDTKKFSDKRFLESFIKYLPKTGKILDLGCGTGRHSKYFFDKHFSVTAIDLSKGMIEVARKLYPEITFEIMDMRRMAYKKFCFDAVWAGYSLFHLNREDFKKTVDKIKATLKPGGIFGLIMQEGQGSTEAVYPISKNQKVHLELYTFKDLDYFLKTRGFRILKHSFRRPKPGIEFPYRKLLVIAKV